MSYTEVILVDEHDQQTGIMEKLEAHRKGLLHRAFSVFIFNKEGNMLLQKRALQKYHSPGLWSNACCSHPQPYEKTMESAQRRLQEELGFCCNLKEIDTFKYFVEFDNGLIEHEFDHLFVGIYDGMITPDADEVQEYKFYSFEELDHLLKQVPKTFTYWFLIAYPIIKKHLL